MTEIDTLEPQARPASAHGIPARIVTWLTIGLWVLYAVALLGIWFSDLAGQGARTFVTLFGAMLTSIATFVWFVFASRFRRSIRMTVALAVILSIGVIGSTLRIQEVTGSLVPRLRFAWQPMPDEQLGAVAADSRAVVDLLTKTPFDFPQFLGPNRNASLDDIELDTDWKTNRPKMKWKQEIGAGWSSFAAVNGYAVTMEQRGESELVTCYEIETGKAVWAHEIKTRHVTIFGGVGPRATPVVHDGRVFAMGATGILRCLDGSTGAKIWAHDLITEFGGESADDGTRVEWGRAGSPLIVDNLVVVTVGGPLKEKMVSLVAYDQETGKEVWNAGELQISYSSPQLFTLCGVRQIVCVLESAICGFDPTDGTQLWKHEWNGSSTGAANCSQPVDVGNDRLLFSKGYARGAELVQFACDERGEWKLESVWAKPTVMKTKFATALVFENHVYGLDDVILECIELKAGRKKWKAGRYGYGQVLRVGRHLLVQAEDGRVVLLEAQPNRSEVKELAVIQAVEGKTWNHLCLYGDRLLVRNSEQAACYELKLK